MADEFQERIDFGGDAPELAGVVHAHLLGGSLPLVHVGLRLGDAHQVLEADVNEEAEHAKPIGYERAAGKRVRGDGIFDLVRPFLVAGGEAGGFSDVLDRDRLLLADHLVEEM